MDKNNPIEYSNQDPKKWHKIGFFGGEDYLIFIFKKTEKISAAIYLISSFLKDNEPIKWELREKAILLLTSTLSLNSIDVGDKSVHVQNFFTTSLETLTLLNISLTAGLISKMNHTILMREIESLVSLLKERVIDDTTRAGYVLSDSFFRADDTLNQPLPRMTTSSSSTRSNSNSSSNNLGSIPSPAADSGAMSGSSNSNAHSFHDRKNDRQETIVNLLRKGSPLTIKDFTNVITGCSEKTIQRELLELVEKGVIKKEGERRWSKYTI